MLGTSVYPAGWEGRVVFFVDIMVCCLYKHRGVHRLWDVDFPHTRDRSIEGHGASRDIELLMIWQVV